MKFWPTPCSEFPNDNPELHDGAVWHCAWTRAKPRAVVPAASTARNATSEPPPPKAASSEAVGQLPLAQPTDPTIPCPAPMLALARSLPANRTSFERLQAFAPLGEVIARQPLLRASPSLPALDMLPPATQLFLSAPVVLDVPSAIVADYPAPDDPFIAELQALVDPLGRRAPDEREASRPTTLRVPRPTDFLLADSDEDDDWETFVDDLFTDPDARPTDIESESESESDAEDEGCDVWGSSLSLRAMTELQERELAALEREVAELRALHDTEVEPGLDAPVSQTVARDPRDSTSAEPDFEPLSLEAFLSGETRVATPPSAATQRLDPLELEFAPAPEADPSWQTLVNAVSRFLLDDNATRAAALVPGLLEGRALNLSRLSDAACDALRAAGIAEDRGRDLVVTRGFRERCARLREAFIARRLDVDTLTRWLATMISALLGAPEQELQILSRLRASQVAAAIERAA